MNGRKARSNGTGIGTRQTRGIERRPGTAKRLRFPGHITAKPNHRRSYDSSDGSGTESEEAAGPSFAPRFHLPQTPSVGLVLRKALRSFFKYKSRGGIQMIFETYYFTNQFVLNGLRVSPVLLRREALRPVISAHQHSYVTYEIHYAASGHGSVTVNGRTWPVKTNALYITGPSVIHQQSNDEQDPVIEYCLTLDCEAVDPSRPSALALFAETTFWMGCDNGHVFPLIKALIEENRNPGIGTMEMSEAILRQIIITLTRLYLEDKPLPKRSSRAMTSVKSDIKPMIDDLFCYQCSNLTLSMLANMLNLSIRQTQRLLQASYGKTFSQKLMEARFASASHMLSNTSLSITEISERLGFSSIEYFSTAFRKFMGCTPRKYRAKHRNLSPDGAHVSNDGIPAQGVAGPHTD